MGYLLTFTNVFWIDIKLLLIESIEHATKTGELSIEQKRGIITLLPKKDKFHAKIINPAKHIKHVETKNFIN